MESSLDNTNCGFAAMEKIKIFKLSPGFHWLVENYKRTLGDKILSPRKPTESMKPRVSISWHRVGSLAGNRKENTFF